MRLKISAKLRNFDQVSMCQTTLLREVEHKTVTVIMTFCLNNNGMGYAQMSLISGEHLYFDSVKSMIYENDVLQQE